MKTDIEYARDIIIGTFYHQKFKWYASEKELWILDYVKWSKLFSNAGIHAPESGDDRFGIAIITETETDSFLGHVAPDRVDTPHLQTLLRECDLTDLDNFCHLIPSLFVDFDRKTLISYFPEPTAFENFVPDGWTSAYRPFYDLIPANERYWIIEGRDLLTDYGTRLEDKAI